MANFNQINESEASSLEVLMMWRRGLSVFCHRGELVLSRQQEIMGKVYGVQLIAEPMSCKVRLTGGYYHDDSWGETELLGSPEQVVPGPTAWPCSDWCPPAQF